MTDQPAIPAIKLAAPGTPYFHVPCRYWETQEPETGRIAAMEEEFAATHAGDLVYVYGFHDFYGHNVYLKSADTFLSREEAVAEAMRRKAAYEAELDAEVEAIMAKFFPKQ